MCLLDIDIIWHQYRESQDNNGGRKINHLMLIEEKSYSADLTFSQRDTMWITHQILTASKAQQVPNTEPTPFAPEHAQSEMHPRLPGME